MVRGLCWVALLGMVCAPWLRGQDPKNDAGEIEQRVDQLMGKLTVEEKLAVLGGDRSFYIRPLPSIRMPAIKMSDGPYGVRTWANSPPAFLFVTTDDGVVPVLNSTAFYTAYVEKHLPVEMHLFEHGPHGVVLAQNLLGPSAWPNLLATWMFRHGWMEK